jgi:large subunit ribosomal protein L1
MSWVRNTSRACGTARSHAITPQILLRAHGFSAVLAQQFSTSSPSHARAKVKPRPPPTKAKLAAKERKKALKARKSVYEQEKMTLEKAINVLRVWNSYTQTSVSVH